MSDVREGRCEGFDRLPAWLRSGRWRRATGLPWRTRAVGLMLRWRMVTGRAARLLRAVRVAAWCRTTPEAAARFDTAGDFESMPDDIPFQGGEKRGLVARWLAMDRDASYVVIAGDRAT